MAEALLPEPPRAGSGMNTTSTSGRGAPSRVIVPSTWPNSRPRHPVAATSRAASRMIRVPLTRCILLAPRDPSIRADHLATRACRQGLERDEREVVREETDAAIREGDVGSAGMVAGVAQQPLVERQATGRPGRWRIGWNTIVNLV